MIRDLRLLRQSSSFWQNRLSNRFRGRLYSRGNSKEGEKARIVQTISTIKHFRRLKPPQVNICIALCLSWNSVKFFQRLIMLTLVKLKDYMGKNLKHLPNIPSVLFSKSALVCILDTEFCWLIYKDIWRGLIFAGRLSWTRPYKWHINKCTALDKLQGRILNKKQTQTKTKTEK